MNYREIVEEAKAELNDEIKTAAKDEVKELLREIAQTELVLEEMKKQLEAKLDADIW